MRCADHSVGRKTWAGMLVYLNGSEGGLNCDSVMTQTLANTVLDPQQSSHSGRQLKLFKLNANSYHGDLHRGTY